MNKTIGILAHVDAGKTTITENLLYKSGAIREIGRVDNGNTQTDSMEILTIALFGVIALFFCYFQ